MKRRLFLGAAVAAALPSPAVPDVQPNWAAWGQHHDIAFICRNGQMNIYVDEKVFTVDDCWMCHPIHAM